MKNLGKLAVLVILGLLFSGDAYPEAGRTAGAFLKIEQGVRAVGLGGTFVGLADDVSCLYWNPAGLSQTEKKEAIFSYNRLGEGIQQGLLAYGPCSLGKGVMGLGINYLTVGGIEERQGFSLTPEGEVSASNMLCAIAYSQRKGSWSAGIKAGYIQERLADDTAAGFSIDLGLLHRRKNLGLGLSLQNMGSLGGSELPETLRLGVSYKKGKLTSLCDLEYPFKDEPRLHAGAEYQLMDIIGLRAGMMKIGSNEGLNYRLSLGAGLNYKNLQFDYAYLFYNREDIDSLKDTHHLSLSVDLRKGLHQFEITIEEIKIGDIFPSKYHYYAITPVGSITIKNNTDETFQNVKVSLNIPGYMTLPAEAAIAELRPHSKLSIPILISLDNAKTFLIDENTRVQAEIKVTYFKKGKGVVSSLNKPLVIFDKNAIDWSFPESVAAFVTPKDGVVKHFSRKVIGSIEQDEKVVPEKILQAMAVFSALSACPLRYISDPSTYGKGKVFDYVQYPRETLEVRSGDCDDFAVLFASCLEHIGIETRIIETLSHVFVSFDTGLTNLDLSRCGLSLDWFIQEDERLWMPVETTMFGSPFMEALKTGIQEYQCQMGSIRRINLRSAWEVYPPAALPPIEKEIEIPQFNDRLKQDIERFKEEAKKGHEKDLSQIKEELQTNPNNIKLYNRAGILYSSIGKLNEAVLTLKKGLEIAPTNSNLHNNLANVYSLMGKLAEATTHYKEALSSNPNEGGVWLNLAMAYTDQGKDAEAKECYQQGLAKFANQGEAVKLLGFDPKEVGVRQKRARENLYWKEGE
ncbi:PorV/PorQ family protein [Patescibacteria group bacterium]|nr:PorV/PorQ family protein [Patescibacteria group bacterium]